MKIVTIAFALLFLVNASASEQRPPFEDQDFSCVVTSENKRYEDIFIILVRKTEFSEIWYKRKHLAAPAGEYGELERVRGCSFAKQRPKLQSPTRISLECEMDGEEGFADIDTVTGVGELYFYMPKIGYGERTALEIQCEKTSQNTLALKSKH